MNKRTLSPYELTQLARYKQTTESLPLSLPVEYHTGFADFCGLSFGVTPAVLIPRVETEGLVELALGAISEKVIDTERALKILEIGTGSGAVILSLAKHLDSITNPVTLTASDISEDALTIAADNAQRLTPNTQISFIKSNLFENITGTFDIIIANLPYIPSNRIAKLDPSVKDHEPLLALDGGETGFELIASLLQQAPQYLDPNGIVLLEHDISHDGSYFKPYLSHFTLEFFHDCFERHRFARLDLQR